MTEEQKKPTWADARRQWREGWRQIGQSSRDLYHCLRLMHGVGGVQMSPELDAISYNGEVRPILGVQAWVEMGLPETYTSGGRIIAGGLVAGGIGAVAGSLAKRQVPGTGGFLVVTGPGFQWHAQFDSRAEQRAREFAAEVSALGGTL